MQIDTINQSCIQMQSYDTEEAGVEFSQCSFVCLSEGLWMTVSFVDSSIWKTVFQKILDRQSHQQ